MLRFLAFSVGFFGFVLPWIVWACWLAAALFWR